MTGTTGTMSEPLRQYQSNISGKQDITEVQKTATLSAAHKLPKVMTWKSKTYFTGKTALHVARIVNTEQLRHWIPYRLAFLCI